MKTSSVIALSAAFAAFLALPIGIETAGSLLFSASLGVIFVADYRRRSLALTRVEARRSTIERLRLAA